MLRVGFIFPLAQPTGVSSSSLGSGPGQKQESAGELQGRGRLGRDKTDPPHTHRGRGEAHTHPCASMCTPTHAGTDTAGHRQPTTDPQAQMNTPSAEH